MVVLGSWVVKREINEGMRRKRRLQNMIYNKKINVLRNEQHYEWEKTKEEEEKEEKNTSHNSLNGNDEK